MEKNKHKIVAAFVGDVVIDESVTEVLHRKNKDSTARQIWSSLSGAHFAVANLEAPVTTFSDARANKKYNLKIAPEALTLFDSRFVLSLANNHIMDFGEQGLRDTLDAFAGRGLTYAGAGLNIEEARKPAVVEVGNSRIGIVCAADPRYQPAGENTPGTCPAEPGLLSLPPCTLATYRSPGRPRAQVGWM